MFNIFDELQIAIVTKEKQERFERAAATRRLLSEAYTWQDGSPKRARSFAEFLALAFKVFGTNGQMNWKL